LWKKRRTINKRFWILKVGVVFILLLILAGNKIPIKFELTSETFTLMLHLKILDIGIDYWFYGYVISFLVAYFLRLLIYSLVKEAEPNIKVKNKDLQSWFLVKTFFWRERGNEQDSNVTSQILIFIKDILIKLVSPDYSFATTFKTMLTNVKLNKDCPLRNGNGPLHFYKKKNRYIMCKNIDGIYECEIHHQKNRRKDFIIYSNWGNVIVASILCIIVIIMEIKGVIFTFLIFHMLSRIIEVVFAFYNDVVRAKMNSLDLSMESKSSNLKRGDRISLAIHSYAELILLFACVYFLSGSGINNNLEGLSMTSFLDFLLYSASVSSFNFSLELEATTYGKIVHVTQVLTSMTLIVLSIATYIGMRDEMSVYEKIEWEEDNYS
jgi:hypothetical protein